MLGSMVLKGLKDDTPLINSKWVQEVDSGASTSESLARENDIG